MIEYAALQRGIEGKMNIASEVEKVGVSYSRLTKLMDEKGNVKDLVDVLDCFGYKIVATKK